jgi:hypothetical protein
MNATDQETTTDRCEACFCTKQDLSVRSPYPHRKILWIDCPVCKGAGLKPKAS